MSVVYTEITLKNMMDVGDSMRGMIEEGKIRQMTVQAVVDTGAWTLVINEDIRQKLGLLDLGFGEANLADGQKAYYPMAGPLEIRWKNRRMIGEALVMPDAPEVLLGAIPLEHMDLTINPQAEAEGFSRELVGVHGDKEMHRV